MQSPDWLTLAVQADQLLTQDRLSEAADRARASLELNSDAAAAHHVLGMVAWRRGRPQDGMDHLRRAGMRQSMSRAANCYDNAFMESCFGTFKTELEMTEYEDHRAARREIAEYIDYYRNDRKHSALGYCTPAQFERLSTCGS